MADLGKRRKIIQLNESQHVSVKQISTVINNNKKYSTNIRQKIGKLNIELAHYRSDFRQGNNNN